MLVPIAVVIISLSWTVTLHCTRTAAGFVSFRLRDFVVPISGRVQEPNTNFPGHRSFAYLSETANSS
jgi:hypothetical protein